VTSAVAAVPTQGIAVVALLAGRDDAITAPGQRTVRVTAVSLDEVAVITDLGSAADAVAAGNLRRCARLTAQDYIAGLYAVAGIAVVADQWKP
jgi:hypothetical protein